MNEEETKKCECGSDLPEGLENCGNCSSPEVAPESEESSESSEEISA